MYTCVCVHKCIHVYIYIHICIYIYIYILESKRGGTKGKKRIEKGEKGKNQRIRGCCRSSSFSAHAEEEVRRAWAGAMSSGCKRVCYALVVEGIKGKNGCIDIGEKKAIRLDVLLVLEGCLSHIYIYMYI